MNNTGQFLTAIKRAYFLQRHAIKDCDRERAVVDYAIKRMERGHDSTAKMLVKRWGQLLYHKGVINKDMLLWLTPQERRSMGFLVDEVRTIRHGQWVSVDSSINLMENSVLAAFGCGTCIVMDSAKITAYNAYNVILHSGTADMMEQSTVAVVGEGIVNLYDSSKLTKDTDETLAVVHEDAQIPPNSNAHVVLGIERR